MAAVFACGACGKKYGWNAQFAGKKVKCNCGVAMTVPVDEPGAAQRIPPPASPAPAAPRQSAKPNAPHVRVPAEEESMIEIDESGPFGASPTAAGGGAGGAGQCPSCRSPLPEEAILCVNCGYNRKTGKQLTTAKAGASARSTQAAGDAAPAPAPGATPARTAGRLAIALGAGAAAAVISGVVWAAIARTTGMELGIVAWGIGLLTGFTMMLVADEGSDLLGGYAALMAFSGLVVGKLLIVNWAFVPIITSELEDSPLAIILAAQAVIWEAAVEQKLPEAADWLTMTMAQGMVEASRIDGEVEPATPPAIVEQQMEQLSEKAGERIAAMEPAQMQASVGRFLDASLGRLSMMERLKLTFSFHDAIWAFLAVSSAYKLATGFSIDRKAS